MLGAFDTVGVQEHIDSMFQSERVKIIPLSTEHRGDTGSQQGRIFPLE